MTITRNFKLCLNAGVGLAPYINVNQFDQGEQWVFTLYQEDGTQYTPSTGAIVGIKADHFGIINTGTVVDGKVVINETQQMTAAAGKAIFELQIDGDTHGTANFIVMVEPKPGNNANYSDSDISGIQQAIDAANLINSLADVGEEPKQFIIDEVDDWLDNHPEATTTVQDGAITAPKLNNSLWDKLLVSEEASGAVASFDDGADDVPVSSLKVALEPIQTGTGDPSPSNIRPIYPANGKNYLDTATTTSDYITYTQGADYYITASPSNSDTRGWSYANCQYKFTLPAGTYKFVWDVRTPSTVGGRGYRVLDSAGTILADGYGATLDTNGASSAFTLNASTNVGVMLKQYEMVARFMIVRSTESNLYAPYQGIMVEQTGANIAHLIDETRAGQGITSTVASEKITATGTASATYANLNYLHPIKIVNGQTYTVMLSKAVNNAIVFRFATDTTDSTYQQATINAGSTKATFTANNNFALFRVYIGNLTNGTSVNISDLQILVGNGDISTFVPYSLTSYPYSLGQSVYGGTVDLATGVLTLTKGFKIYDGTETWGTENTYNFYSGTGRGTGVQDNGYLCSHLHFTGILANSTDTSKMPSAYISASGNFNVQRVDIEHTGSAMQQWCLEQYQAGTPLTVVFDLNSPTTVQLTPTEVKTLLGYNNISSSGTVDVIYHADTKLYVDKMTNVDNAIIAPTEATFTATRNYTVNDLLIVADTLYKVTSNIASGSTITPNSNVQQTTLSALIKALS